MRASRRGVPAVRWMPIMPIMPLADKSAPPGGRLLSHVDGDRRAAAGVVAGWRGGKGWERWERWEGWPAKIMGIPREPLGA